MEHERLAPFGAEVYAHRLGNLQEAVLGRGLSGVLLTSRVSRLYFSGFGPEAGTLGRFIGLCVPAHGEPVYVISHLDHERVLRFGIDFAQPAGYGEGLDLALRAIAGWGGGSLGVEAQNLPLAIAERLGGARSLVAADDLVTAPRLVKSEEEIQVLADASRITDLAAEEARGALTDGVTELELAGRLVDSMMRHGADGPSILPFVLAGERAMMPHLRPAARAVQSGEITVIDYGASLLGYETDICRSIACGKPSALAEELHGIVMEAFQAAAAMCRPGVGGGEVHEAAAAVIARAGYGETFNHAVGHGVGLQSHEAPLLNTGSATILREGMVLAIEPAIYFGGIGMRIEDDVVVRPGGGQSLNRCAKGL